VVAAKGDGAAGEKGSTEDQSTSAVRSVANPAAGQVTAGASTFRTDTSQERIVVANINFDASQ
jgi:hypothetical protein